MTSDIYHKVGRGGAGNYYSQQDVEATTQNTAEDLEAQSPPPPTNTPRPAPPPSQPQEYAHTGRGGAGNFYSPQELQQSGTFSGSAAADATAPVKDDGRGSKELGHYGRGGAGNYREGEEKAVVEERGGFREEVVRDVEMGLREPEKAHLGLEKGGLD